MAHPCHDIFVSRGLDWFPVRVASVATIHAQVATFGLLLIAVVSWCITRLRGLDWFGHRFVVLMYAAFHRTWVAFAAHWVCIMLAPSGVSGAARCGDPAVRVAVM